MNNCVRTFPLKLLPLKNKQHRDYYPKSGSSFLPSFLSSPSSPKFEFCIFRAFLLIYWHFYFVVLDNVDYSVSYVIFIIMEYCVIHFVSATA